MPKIHTITNNRTSHTCGKCGKPIPKRAGYRWAKRRYGPRMVRCLSPKCMFRATDLSDSKVARITEAIEAAYDQIAGAESHDDIQDALQTIADVAQEVADEYQEASDGWKGGQGHEEFQDKADACGSFADELDGWQYSDEADEETIRSEDYAQRVEDEQNTAWERALQSMRDEAEDLLGSFDL